MKKAILLSLLFVACAFTASAQKFALIDMEYILKNIPAYEQANNQLNQASQQYQAEIEAKAKEAEALYKDYQKTASSLSAAQKSQKEEAIIAKEKEAAELRKKYFGPEGEMAKTIENMSGKEIKAQGISQILHRFSPKNHSVKCLRVLHTMILAMLRI